MCLVWRRFQQTPTVITIDTTTHPIWDLPFPAVAICNFNKIYQPEADRLKADFQRVGLTNAQIEDFLQSLPKLVRPEYITVNVNPGMRAMAALGYTVETLMRRLMQPCDKMLIKCAWLGNLYNCSKMFRTIKSTEGFCCAFNYHAMIASDSVATCYRIPSTYQKFVPGVISSNTESEQNSDWVPGVEGIEKVAGSGRDVGLSVIFDLEENFYGGATRPYIGASVMLYDAEDYPEISVLTSLAEPGKEIDIAITGTIVESVPSVRTLSVERRRCWFDDEVSLKSSPLYSYPTCVTECRIEHIRSLCNCIPFYYPHSYTQTRTCGLTDVHCLRTYRRVLSSLQTPIDMGIENSTLETAECQCLPQCTDRWYSFTTEATDMKQVKYDAPMFQYYSHGLDVRNLSLIYVYFRDISCLKYRKDIWLTWDGLFASFGGIFGLCLGGSVISLIELVYFYVVRIFHKRNYQAVISVKKSVTSKLQNKNIKWIDVTTNPDVNNHNPEMLMSSLWVPSNNSTVDDAASLSTEFKSFRASTRLKHNRIIAN
ncbi:sodium channel protein Nach [Neodiprion pinetum]|uniref:sodium channel protein Nach n=1 Tax=Neodiprion pinetum TaxID=441929 RepID=UPI00372313B7